MSRDNTIDIELTMMLSTGINGMAIREWTPPADRIRATIEALNRLDNFLNPGLDLHEFLQLFAICRQCRKVMTRRVVLIHECAPADVQDAIMIDLTEEH